jgi:hypothetical protein
MFQLAQADELLLHCATDAWCGTLLLYADTLLLYRRADSCCNHHQLLLTSLTAQRPGPTCPAHPQWAPECGGSSPRPVTQHVITHYTASGMSQQDSHRTEWQYTTRCLHITCTVQPVCTPRPVAMKWAGAKRLLIAVHLHCCCYCSSSKSSCCPASRSALISPPQ